MFAILASSSGDPPDYLADPGEWIWSALITTEPDSAAAFYQTLLGYDVYDITGADEAQHLQLASDNFARASVNPLPPNAPGVRPQWLDYIRVYNADQATAKAVSLGAHVLVRPQPDRHGGKIAVIADPQGAVIGLLEWSDDANAAGAK